MSLPIIICDDSSFARKQIARALPQDWDVEVTYAGNGLEGIEALRAGKGDVIFLDLTMPELDGFGVLEAIKDEGIEVIAIVVSGDIQPESQRRVDELGAAAFIKKPVREEELLPLLDRYGLLKQESTGDGVREEGTTFLDWCQEISNVAMGRAADLLATMIGENVELSIPKVSQIDFSEVITALELATGGEGFSVVGQGFIGSGIAGETMLVFHDADMIEIAQVMHYTGDLGESDEVELLMDVSNVLVGAYLKGLADLLDIHFSQGHPMIQLHNKQLNFGQGNSGGGPRPILAIELSYTIGESRVQADQLVLITEGSVPELASRAEMALG
ncbi:hypothetical protein BOW53_08730 [Solemya pervernicosa gill symbiont]|uniref:Response regulatory domain-containing protein n=2 Tax=Gammaproteobacteria incertae sedis TaxID=118884 RepID=A0A1T2L4Y9_9GAMM|nr:response regulator [Candidatus Reidiella endopervernicosa]OOZ40177.1 hypothetical protein BOW53_08730 [Solemya pervernicosa gill symbiont]QKQ25119.1 response regulator [Candidatus Reidiella endopervernicosa]